MYKKHYVKSAGLPTRPDLMKPRADAFKQNSPGVQVMAGVVTSSYGLLQSEVIHG